MGPAVTVEREKFATRIDKSVLAAVRKIARDEGRQLHGVVEEALTARIQQRAATTARPHAMQAYSARIACFGSVYKKLAK